MIYKLIFDRLLGDQTVLLVTIHFSIIKQSQMVPSIAIYQSILLNISHFFTHS